MTMAQVQKIVLSSSRDIPFNKLLLSQSNVRRIKAGVSIEELAEDIARRTLLQSLTARPVCDADGNETGMFEIPAGGRRYRALELLVKQKRLAKTAPIPCVVREGGSMGAPHRALRTPCDAPGVIVVRRPSRRGEDRQVRTLPTSPVSVSPLLQFPVCYVFARQTSPQPMFALRH